MSDKATSEHFLVQIEHLLDWAPLAPLVEHVGERLDTDNSSAVVKMLLLARWYGLSEAALLEACEDRASFRRFLRLSLTDRAGDAPLVDAFRRHATRAPVEAQSLIHAIEAQLLAKGFRIRPGIWAEAYVVPVAAGPAADTFRPTETMVFRPGEIENLRKKNDGLLARAGAMMVAATSPPGTDPVVLQARDLPQAPPVHAILEWPWGAATELDRRLGVGRDRHFCPYAAELAPYEYVSRKHAELDVCPLGVWVRDLSSRNGTYVNAKKLDKGTALLLDADARIGFGPGCEVQLKLKN